MISSKHKILFFLSLGALFSPGYAYPFSGERIVTNAVDGFREGNLRVILQDACADNGPDTIIFDDGLFFQDQVSIEVVEPLVIPRDCKGSVTISGSDRAEIILDGSRMANRDPNQPRGRVPGDACLIHVYSNGNIIENLTFGNSQLGAAVCVFGQGNIVRNNRMGTTLAGQIMANRYGVVLSDALGNRFADVDGSGNQVLANNIGPSTLNGIWVHAHASQFEANEISNSTQTGFEVYGNDHEITGNKIKMSGNNGLFLSGDGLQVLQNEIIDSETNGLFLSGDDLRVAQNEIINSGANGVWIRGSDSELDENKILSNFGHGVWIEGHDIKLTRNQILANGGCAAPPLLASQNVDCYGGRGQGVGIYVTENSHDLQIGGGGIGSEGNTIRFNANGGIFVDGDENTERIHITHNLISRNYGTMLGIDLGLDDITYNDWLDEDEGPNHLLNFIDHFQAFPLVPSPQGEDRYWSWGVARVAEYVEVYKVHPEDIGRDLSHGGGDSYLGQYGIGREKTFDIMPDDDYPLESGIQVTMVSLDHEGNVSEYSNNIPIGHDQDADGIIDDFETGDGTPQSRKTKFDSADSDNDGLPDSVEDANRNGECEPDLGETGAYNADTDGDGLSDFFETHGDGVYDEGVDTDPNNPDTDGDGLVDGREDANQNGIVDGYLGESNPITRDSDGDYIDDYRDNCPSIFNPGQEIGYCGNR